MKKILIIQTASIGDVILATPVVEKLHHFFPEAKIDLLFKLVEVYRQTDQWEKALACWQAVLTADPQNLKARLALLKYAYLLADGLGHAGRSMSKATAHSVNDLPSGRRPCNPVNSRWVCAFTRPGRRIALPRSS